MLLFSHFHYMPNRRSILHGAFQLTFITSQRLLLIYDPIKLILIHLLQIIMHLNYRALTYLGTGLAKWNEFIIVHVVDTFFNLSIDALLNYNVAELVLTL